MDIGAVEYAIKGDLNFDGSVSIADFITLASNFNKNNATWPDGDLNGDRTVTIADFIDLAANFGQSLASSPQLPLCPHQLRRIASRRHRISKSRRLIIVFAIISGRFCFSGIGTSARPAAAVNPVIALLPPVVTTGPPLLN